MTRLKFGTFLAPIHEPGQNPTLLLQRDLEFVQYLEQLGYDEAWFGEHHSAGAEIYASPEIMIAAAGERTSRIKLGTGVTSVSYHNPLWAAERMIMLDHLTRGRALFGLGPGSLPTDAAMLGLSQIDTRELLAENTDIIMRLLRGETVTAKTRTHELFDAKIQMAPYSDPLFDVVVAAIASPTGARLAGKYGIGLLSIAATLTADGFSALQHHWGLLEEFAAQAGRSDEVDRSTWRLVGPFHIAETKEQAYKDVEHGIEYWFNYLQHVAAFPQMDVRGTNKHEMIDFINTSGIGVIGTADEARAQVQRLIDQSGGFGTLLIQGHDWANPQATRRSYELFAQDVMPYFQGQAQPMIDAAARAQAVREGQAAEHVKAVEHMTKKYEAELGRV
ncbi:MULTISPECIES: LLM class flavin-dependent oxidoreductase [Gordonia]|uniref:LLM class flavin-dependent oxidoreductase n=2 Tax=Gordonia TaxID=2053 RepID=A0A243Q4R0_9ACTN|nr:MULTISPECIES: LLM class flavin-dependent oxidoreductase [Gordonia]QIK46530.1 LLM class flavin-dependent oxidoreductase [Gordonia terrae]KSU61163.1 monooxygenase [Gordonia sp. SGD-V-85]MBR7193726.1 LLM class flavin-dependent oxidoreductase [Gordonia sp. SCSIO 19800]MCX2753729.1 LLM class flavin-dependent oxidoreductase [Gordonia sp. 4N]OUC76412.1 LLM class flavin-dependent oxidoreductase [Gordonia lacunae]